MKTDSCACAPRIAAVVEISQQRDGGRAASIIPAPGVTL
jgi:hypothetical protein